MNNLVFQLKEPTNNTESFIELNKLLKFLQLCENGGMANTVISNGLVKVNNKIDTRKRAKIRKGDKVVFQDAEILVE